MASGPGRPAAPAGDRDLRQRRDLDLDHPDRAPVAGPRRGRRGPPRAGPGPTGASTCGTWPGPRRASRATTSSTRPAPTGPRWRPGRRDGAGLDGHRPPPQPGDRRRGRWGSSWRLDETSDHAPAVGAAGGWPWPGPAPTATSTCCGPATAPGAPGAAGREELRRPALGTVGDDLVLAWTGTNRRLNVLTTGPGEAGPSGEAGGHQPVQPGGVRARRPAGDRLDRHRRPRPRRPPGAPAVGLTSRARSRRPRRRRLKPAGRVGEVSAGGPRREDDARADARRRRR